MRAKRLPISADGPTKSLDDLCLGWLRLGNGQGPGYDLPRRMRTLVFEVRLKACLDCLCDVVLQLVKGLAL